MTRSFFMAALLAATGAAAASAQSQSKVLVLIGHPVDNEFYFGHNADDPAILSQRVIPSKKGLRGVSFEESIIKPDSSVNSQTPIKAFVTTADWPNGSPVDVGPVECITVDGGQTIDHGPEDENNPALPGDEDAAVADAVKISTFHSRLRFTRITGWRGTGAWLTWPTGTVNPTGKYEGNVIENCHIGIAVAGDSEVIGNTIRACRDYGLYNPDPAGNVTIANNHLYGCNGQTVGGEYDGICVYLGNGSGWRLVGNTMADSHFGFVAAGGTSHSSAISACTFFKNSRCAIQIRPLATNFLISDCTINVPISTAHPQFNDMRGIELAGLRNLVRASVIWLDGNEFSQPAGLPEAMGEPGTGTAVRVTGNNNELDNVLILDAAYPTGKARGIHIPSVIEGFKADVKIWGFDQTGDVFLDIDTPLVKGLDITIRGNHTETNEDFPIDLNDENVARYVDIPANWDSTNSIRFINEANGDTHTLTPGQSYEE